MDDPEDLEDIQEDNYTRSLQTGLPGPTMVNREEDKEEEDKEEEDTCALTSSTQQEFDTASTTVVGVSRLHHTREATPTPQHGELLFSESGGGGGDGDGGDVLSGSSLDSRLLSGDSSSARQETFSGDAQSHREQYVSGILHDQGSSQSGSYGTFQQPKESQKKKVSFNVKDQPKARQPGSRVNSKRLWPRRWTEYNDALLTSAEVDHLCDDAHDVVSERPSFAHWRSLMLATLFCCPALGIVGIVFLCKSSRSARDDDPQKALRMLRHSDFFFRLAIMCGIVLWFISFLFLVLHFN